LGAELITEKGRVYKFDDLTCLLQYKKTHPEPKPKLIFVTDYEASGLIDASKASYVLHASVKSPMQGNTAAFASKQAAENFAAKVKAVVNTWDEIANQ
jgi:copper chaperone NosL